MSLALIARALLFLLLAISPASLGARNEPAPALQAQAPDSPSSVVPLPGIRLSVSDTGGNGVPVILLHANTGTIEAWQNQIPAFSAAGYRVIAFDRRGWGKSLADPATGPQPGTVADDLDALANHLRLPRFHVVGVAGGGFIGLDYAIAHPDKVLSLVVAASSGGVTDREMEEMREKIRQPGFASSPREFQELGVAYRAANPGGMARWIEIMRGAQQKGAPEQPLKTPQTFEKLTRVRTPTLILAGGADLLAPPAMMQMLVKSIPRAEFAVVSDAGHSVAWERPDEFNRVVLSFLRKNGS